MATTGMSYVVFVACLLLYFAPKSIDAINFHFDDSSCDSLLPETDAVTPGRPNDPNDESSPDDVFPNSDRKSSQNQHHSHLVASNEAPPYTIVTPTEYYRRDRHYTVTLGGGEFNGFILQARQFLSYKPLSEVSGSFTDPPPGVKILECHTAFDTTPANTAVSTDTSPKTSVTLTWKSPPENMGNIEFVATFVKNYTYWPNVKSSPLTFKEFPPSLKSCGATESCYRFSGTSGECTSDQCNFLFVSEVKESHVVFTLGGKVRGTQEYIGVGFTSEKFIKVEMFACFMEYPEQAFAGHYVAEDIESWPAKKHQFLETTEADYEGDRVWCRFRRPVKIPGVLRIPGSRLSDFTQNQTMMFLRGPLSDLGGSPVPQLGKSAVFAEHQWNRTAVVDTLVTVDGVSRGEPLIGLILVSIVVTLFHAATN